MRRFPKSNDLDFRLISVAVEEHYQSKPALGSGGKALFALPRSPCWENHNSILPQGLSQTTDNMSFQKAQVQQLWIDFIS